MKNIIKDNKIDYNNLRSLGYPINFLEEIRYVLDENNVDTFISGYDVPASYFLENFGYEHHYIALKSNNYYFVFEYFFDNDNYAFTYNVVTINVVENLNALGDKNENE